MAEELADDRHRRKQRIPLALPFLDSMVTSRFAFVIGSIARDFCSLELRDLVFREHPAARILCALSIKNRQPRELFGTDSGRSNESGGFIVSRQTNVQKLVLLRNLELDRTN